MSYRGKVQRLEAEIDRLEAQIATAGASGSPRSQLWEVTNKSSNTCTVKKVKEFSSGSSVLLDESERSNVVFDPNDEPSVGDRGTLLNHGGTLFFFKKSGASYGKQYYCINERYVKEVGSSGDVIIYEQEYDGSAWGTTIDTLYVGKLDTRIPVSSSEFVQYNHENQMEVRVNGQGDDYSYIIGYMTVKVIQEDFTLSTVTRADVEALAGGEANRAAIGSVGSYTDYIEGRCTYAGSNNNLQVDSGYIYGIAAYFDEGSFSITTSGATSSDLRTFESGNRPPIFSIHSDLIAQ